MPWLDVFNFHQWVVKMGWGGAIQANIKEAHALHGMTIPS